LWLFPIRVDRRRTFFKKEGDTDMNKTEQRIEDELTCIHETPQEDRELVQDILVELLVEVLLKIEKGFYELVHDRVSEQRDIVWTEEDQSDGEEKPTINGEDVDEIIGEYFHGGGMRKILS